MADLHLLSPAGFRAAGVACGIKSEKGRKDLALLVADQPAAAAAVFTTNKLRAAPVVLGRETMKAGRLRAIVVNSGNANSCTGHPGMADARTMAAEAAKAIGTTPGEVLVGSTGIIGQRLPMDKVIAGIADAEAHLADDSDAAMAFAEGIMTTDIRPKMFGASGTVGGARVIVAGACKGAGMISPNMATMLAYLTTDAAMMPDVLQAALAEAVEESFNAITVDGHGSTNDTVAILASGAAGGDEIAAGTPAYHAFLVLLKQVCTDLAVKIVADGEGATRVVEVRVEGAASVDDAKLAARAVANSPLVKCAVHGSDPNWGRVVSAVGYSGAKIDVAKLQHWIGNALVYADETPTAFDEDACAEYMKGDRVLLRVDLGAGDATATVTTCDLSKEYVTINADYHT
jgi:glutamate N-acetyltransferase / amino-acid N-acetyltransferase